MATRLASGGDTMAVEHSSSNQTNPTLYNKLKETVFMTAFGGVYGAVSGGIVGMVIMAPIARRYPQVLAPLSRTQYARRFARENSALSAAMWGIESIMLGIRGKDDLTNSLVSGSGAGLAYSFVRHDLKVKPAHALSWAAYLAVLCGTMYKVIENYLRIQHIDEKFLKNTHLSTNIFVILTSKSQTQIYN
ncbi:BnaA06g39770D, partial [Brassica napus]